MKKTAKNILRKQRKIIQWRKSVEIKLNLKLKLRLQLGNYK